MTKLKWLLSLLQEFTTKGIQKANCLINLKLWVPETPFQGVRTWYW